MMGIYDRDYERGYGGQEWRPEGGGLQLRWPRTTVGWVLLVTFAVYVVSLFFNEQVVTNVGGIDRVVTINRFVDVFKLHSDWYLQPWRVYGLLTYGLLHDPQNFFHIAGNMFGFWMFGRMLESRFGSREFAAFYVGAILAGAVAFCIGQLIAGAPGVCIGASAGTVAVVLLCALLYPHQPVQMLLIPIQFPLWVLGAFIVVSDVLGALGRPGSTVAFAAHLGGAAFAFAYFKQQWRLADYLPQTLAMPSFKRRPNLRVYQDDEEDSPSHAQQAADDRVDELLRKVHASGMDSLSRAEKKELEKASRRSRNRPK